jgi:quercetin dioxygenase-like cupin family protein
MTTPLPPLRRIVTANDANGKSYFAEDTTAPVRPANPLNPGAVKYDVWATSRLPAPVDEPDQFFNQRGICPPEGATVMHVLDMPPEPTDPEALKAYVAMRHEDISKRPPMAGVRYHHGEGSGAYGMHETESIDYAIVLEGEIIAVLDSGERVMRQGDIMIQRGTSHSWVNRSGRMARMAFIIASGKFA